MHHNNSNPNLNNFNNLNDLAKSILIELKIKPSKSKILKLSNKLAAIIASSSTYFYSSIPNQHHTND